VTARRDAASADDLAAGGASPEPAERRPSLPRVAVIGAGLTGLATAWHLRDEAEVTVFDAADRVGGQILTADLAGAPLDVGADAFLARQPEAEALVRAVGFGDDDLVAPATGRVHLWVGGRLRPLPEATVLGAPTSLRAVAASGALRPTGLLRAAAEPLLPRRRVVGDRSVADLIGERFGRQVVDTLVEPLLGGVYAGNTDRLSASATVPPVWAAAREHRSLSVGLREHRARTAGDTRPVFLTLRDGLGALTGRLRDHLGERVRTRARVTGLARIDDRWEVRTADAAANRPGDGAGSGRSRTYDVVVLTVSAAAAAELLRPVDAEVAREFAGIRTASVGVVALAYDPADARSVPDGSGLLVPRSEARLIKAVTVSSRKWPHHRDHGGSFRLRASVGRVDDTTALDLDDATLAERVDAEVRWALRLRHPARERSVVRWPGALPQYEVGHLARVDRIRYRVADRLPGLQVGGASLDGVGLAARARDAGRLAEEVRHRLRTVAR
jgi:protoporphyrinogen/coproporphyrinogen III oxidase